MLGDDLDHDARRILPQPQRPAKIAHQGQLDREAEAVVRPPASVDQRDIIRLDGVSAEYDIPVGRRIEQPGALAGRQQGRPLGHEVGPRRAIVGGKRP